MNAGNYYSEGHIRIKLETNRFSWGMLDYVRRKSRFYHIFVDYVRAIVMMRASTPC